MKAYHGVTIVAASLTGLPGNHRDFDLPLPGFLHTGCPHHYRFAQDGESEEDFATRLAAELEAMIVKEGPDTVAAFIAEPVMGAGGVIVPPRTYFEKIMDGLRQARRVHDQRRSDLRLRPARHDVRLREAQLCAAVDLVAKMLSSAYLPIAGVMIPESMYQALLIESKKIGVFGHGFTYGGHPVSAAVALKAIEIYARDRIVENAAERGVAIPGAAQGARRASAGRRSARPRLDRRARTRRRQEHQALLRRRSTASVARAVQFAEAEGLIVRAVLGDVLTLSPPLVISEEEIDDLFDRLTRALDKTLDWVTRERLAHS